MDRPNPERMAGSIGVSLLWIEDPYVTDVVNGHCTERYKLGLDRLLAIEVHLRNTSRTETASISGSNFHLFDDASYVHPSIGLDSRRKKPELIETYLVPGGAARGWVTFLLPWERQAARVQFFTGYLSGKVAAFDLPLVGPPDLAQRRAEAANARARLEAARLLDDKEREVLDVEARARAARVLLEQEERLRELAARAASARATIAEVDGRIARAPPSAVDAAAEEGTEPAIELAAVYEAAVGHAPDAGFADRARAVLSANGNPTFLPEYLLEALKRAASGELVAPTEVPPDLHGLGYYLGELAPLFPDSETHEDGSSHIELSFPRQRRAVVVNQERWSVVERGQRG